MTLREAFDCEIFKMAQIGIYLKRCEYCGKYFIFNPNKPARYCNTKLSNVNMTCQQVASQEKYNKNISPIQKEYPFPIRESQAASVYRCPLPYGQTLHHLHGTHICSGLSRILCIFSSYGATSSCPNMQAFFSVSCSLHMPCRTSTSTYLSPP